MSADRLLLPVLSADGMRAADSATMADWGVPGRTLMETAGRAVADAVEAELGSAAGRTVVVLAGKGNNGGDGLVAARVLHARGSRVHVAALATDQSPPDTAANLALLHRLAESSDRLTVGAADARLPERPDAVVDALLGIGVAGALRDPVAGLCAAANAMRGAGAPVVAVDVPSGLDADTGAAADGSVRATVTLAMGGLKAGLLLGAGPALAGRVQTVEIGIPAALLREHAAAWTPGDGWLDAVLPRRAADAHKYAAGRALCVVGSRAYTGAAVLATRAACRAGAGAVVAAVPESVRATLDAHALEVMAAALPETADGTLAESAGELLVERLGRTDAVLIGCGLGRHDETQAAVRSLAARAAAMELPTVLDADALHAVRPGSGPELSGPFVLTPHLGEMRRLVGDSAWTPTDRVAAVREWATRWGVTLVLKGMPSVVGGADGRVWVGPPPAPGLATAGTGDVLAGMTVGLLAQGLPPAEAALAALGLGARAAARFAESARPASMLASDLLAP